MDSLRLAREGSRKGWADFLRGLDQNLRDWKSPINLIEATTIEAAHAKDGRRSPIVWKKRNCPVFLLPCHSFIMLSSGWNYRYLSNVPILHIRE